METANSKVNFGKYKDCDIDCLLQDHKYIGWLLSQAWFERCYPEIHKVIKKKEVSVTVSGNPASSSVAGKSRSLTRQPVGSSRPTPDHNRLQNKFLDLDYSRRFYKLVTGLTVNHVKVIFEAQHNWDVVIVPSSEAETSATTTTPTPTAVAEPANQLSLKKVKYPSLCVELKTVVADEYPCILRKMKEQIRVSSTVLTQTAYAIYIKNYKGDSANKDQLRQIFQQEFDIQVVFGDDSDEQLLG